MLGRVKIQSGNGLISFVTIILLTTLPPDISAKNILYPDQFISTATDYNKGIFANGFTIKDVNRVLVEFESSFERGDLDKFLTLFDTKVRTEDGKNREELSKDYAELFVNTDRRRIKFKNAVWKENNNGEISGDIDFILNIRNRIDAKISRFSGIMRIYFKKKGKNLVIDGIFHAYDENPQFIKDKILGNS